MVKYCINYYRSCGRISIWIHKRHGQAMGCLCEYLWENWPRYNGTALYFALPHTHHPSPTRISTIFWCPIIDLVRHQGPYATWDVRPKRILKSNLVKSRLPTTYFPIDHSFWSFAQSMVVILPCSVPNFKTIGQLKRMLWANTISRDFSLTHWLLGYLNVNLIM